MDESVEDGNAFAIPDLWKTSTLADHHQDRIESIALPLEPLGMPIVSGSVRPVEVFTDRTT